VKCAVVPLSLVNGSRLYVNPRHVMAIKQPPTADEATVVLADGQEFLVQGAPGAVVDALRQ
jgi:uncharacterized protein YlzI (FlbEa/FlbD family)